MFAELRAAPLPPPLKPIAVHLYLNFHKNNQSIERWELWQSTDAFTKITNTSVDHTQKNQFFHIYKNLKAPLDGVGGGPSFLISTFKESQAEQLYHTTLKLSETYQHRTFYRAYPGPNSNTFIATIFKDSQIPVSLPATAIGKDYSGLKPTFYKDQNKFRIETPLIGLHYHKHLLLELHLLGLTIGYVNPTRQWMLPLGKGFFPYSKNSSPKTHP